MLSNTYFLAKFRFDTAENEPAKKIAKPSTHLSKPRYGMSCGLLVPQITAEPNRWWVEQLRLTGRLDTPVEFIASKGGAPAHPAWFLNLREQDQVKVQVARDVFQARTRIASGAEREKIWQQMASMYPPFTDYQAKTDREIPVVVLERVA